MSQKTKINTKPLDLIIWGATGFTGKLVADCHEEYSLAQMVKATRVVYTTVGPYTKYGDLLVKLCEVWIVQTKLVWDLMKFCNNGPSLL